MKKPSVQLNVLLSTLYQILSMVTPLITAPYTARVLGATGVGINSYTTSIQTYFLLLAAFGTYVYGSREIARNRDDAYRRSQSFWEIELVTVCTTVLCLLGWAIVILAGGDNRAYYIIKTFHLIAVMFEISWFFSGIERFDYTVWINTVIKLIGIVCVFLFIKTPAHLGRFMLIFAVSTFLGNLSLWVFLPKYVQRPDWKNLRVWHHFPRTLTYFIPTIATSVYTVLDKTLIGWITNDNAQNGYYEQATKIINMAKSVSFVALNNVLTSRMSYLYAQKDHQQIRQRTNQSMGYIAFMCVGVTFGLIAVAPNFVVAFFGPEYVDVIQLLQVFSPIILIIGISNCIAAHYYTPAGHFKQISVFLIIGAAVNLVLNCIMIPKFGSMGAAIASVIAELVITVLHIAFSRGMFTLGYLCQHFWRKIVAGLAMIAAILPLQNAFSKPVITVLCQVPLGVLVYCLTLLLLRDNYTTSMAKSIIGRIQKIISPKGSV